jgi:hypothetical protein
MKSEVYKRKLDTRDELLARILDAAASINNVELNSDQHHVTVTYEFQSALRSTVGFSEVYFELQQISHFCVRNLSV